MVRTFSPSFCGSHLYLVCTREAMITGTELITPIEPASAMRAYSEVPSAPS